MMDARTFGILLSLTSMVVVIVVMVLNTRASWAIHRAHQQRMSAITAMTFRPMTHGALSKAVEAVPFGNHIKAVFWGRDPWALYDPIVREAVDNPITEVMGPMEFHEMSRGDKPTFN